MSTRLPRENEKLFRVDSVGVCPVDCVCPGYAPLRCTLGVVGTPHLVKRQSRKRERCEDVSSASSGESFPPSVSDWSLSASQGWSGHIAGLRPRFKVSLTLTKNCPRESEVRNLDTHLHASAHSFAEYYTLTRHSSTRHIEGHTPTPRALQSQL